MQEFVTIFTLIALGAAFIFFIKGVWEVNSRPDTFRFQDFVWENANRLSLLAFGLLVTALILFLDPGGLQELFKTLPGGIQFGSPLLIGAGLAGITLVMPRKEPLDTPERPTADD